LFGVGGKWFGQDPQSPKTGHNLHMKVVSEKVNEESLYIATPQLRCEHPLQERITLGRLVAKICHSKDQGKRNKICHLEHVP
jgi:hypothetical protein